MAKVVIGRSEPSALKSVLHDRPTLTGLILVVAAFALLLTAGALQPRLLQPASVMNILRQAVALGITSIGQTLAILSGGVDLSVGGVAIFTNVVLADLLQGSDANNLVGLSTVFGLAALFGLINGLGITKLGINPFVMTLGSGIMIQGFALVYTQGAARGAASPLIHALGTGRIGGWLPTAVLLWLVLSGLALWGLSSTVFGRRLYAVGDNPQVARLSGIHVDRILMGVYVLSALCAALTGVMVTGYIGTGTLEWGEDYRLTSLAAVVMGGTPFVGGTGGYFGTAGAVLTLTMLNTLLTMLRVSEAVRQMVYGAIVVLVLVMGRWRKHAE